MKDRIRAKTKENTNKTKQNTTLTKAWIKSDGILQRYVYSSAASMYRGILLNTQGQNKPLLSSPHSERCEASGLQGASMQGA